MQEKDEWSKAQEQESASDPGFLAYFSLFPHYLWAMQLPYGSHTGVSKNLAGQRYDLRQVGAVLGFGFGYYTFQDNISQKFRILFGPVAYFGGPFWESF